MIKPWQILKRETPVNNSWLTVYADDVLTGTGVILPGYYTVKKRDFALVVPLTEDGRLVVIREYKHAAGAVVYALPAGIIDEGEEPATAAARELTEESGYLATQLEHLGTWLVSDAFISDKAHLYLATGVQPGGVQHGDPSEEIEVELLPFSQVLAEVGAGGFFAGLAAATAVLLAAQRLHSR